MEDDQGLTGKQKLVVVVGSILLTAGAILWATDRDKKRKKERMVEEYLERIGILEAAKRRLLDIFFDPNKTEDDFLDAVKEEKILLGILAETE